MSFTQQSQPFRNLVEAFKRGDISRRRFIEGACALGAGGGLATFMANTAVAGGGRNGFAFYQGADGTPAASPVAGGAAAAPAVGMENVTRGEGGELRMIQWQAATSAFSHTATGTKDFLISDMVLEPLLRYLPDGTIIPDLAAEVPSVENGLLEKDLSSVTFKLKEGVLWNDGEPFTSRDVQFTWEWITTESNASVNFLPWSTIAGIETPDELPAVVKESFNQIGIGVTLEQIDAGIYFGGEAGNEQNINHFYWDIDMYTNGPSSPVPVQYMIGWYGGTGVSGDNIAQASNDWQGQNFQRYVNEEYDAGYEELLTVTEAERANELLIEMNDILINDVAVIPQVNRAADKYAISLEINNENVALSPFELNYWNIAHWNRTA